MLANITPGDRVTFNIKIRNNSNVKVKYRIKLNFSGELASGLAVYTTLPGADLPIVLSTTETKTDWLEFDNSGIVAIPMDIELPINASNNYQGKSAEIMVLVEAVQSNAVDGVFMNNIKYSTLNEAVDAATNGETIYLIGDAEYVYPANATNSVIDMKNVTIIGSEISELTIKNAFNDNVGGTCSLANLNLKNLSVNDETYYNSENGENAWEFTYLEICGNGLYENVVFNDGIMIEDDLSNMQFKNCTFIGHNNDSSSYGDITMYGVWVYAGIVDFNDCIFTGNRGLKVHAQYNDEQGNQFVGNVVVNDSKFVNLQEKPGVVLGSVKADSVIINNCSFENTQAGDSVSNPSCGIPYIYESDTNELNFLGTTTLKVKEEATLQTLLVHMDNMSSGYNANLSVELLNDLDYSDIEWVNCDIKIAASRTFSINGNGYTISHITANEASYGGNGFYSHGLLSTVLGANETSICKVENLTVDNFRASGSLRPNDLEECAAAIIGELYFATAVINDVNVTNANITNTKYVGGIVGRLDGKELTIYNCSITDSIIDGHHSAGLIGFIEGNTVLNVDKVTVDSNDFISANNDGTQGRSAAALVGTYFADVNITNASVLNNTYSITTGKYDSFQVVSLNYGVICNPSLAYSYKVNGLEVVAE